MSVSTHGVAPVCLFTHFLLLPLLPLLLRLSNKEGTTEPWGLQGAAGKLAKTHLIAFGGVQARGHKLPDYCYDAARTLESSRDKDFKLEDVSKTRLNVPSVQEDAGC